MKTNEKFGAALLIPTVAVAVGAGVGSKVSKEHPVRGAVIGGLSGVLAIIGVAVSRGGK